MRNFSNKLQGFEGYVLNVRGALDALNSSIIIHVLMVKCFKPCLNIN